MAELYSPGVSVTVTDQSFFFPTVATTVPLFFLATRSGKVQVDGSTPAAGTLESNVVRTVTSQSQSLALYGVPYFHNDISGNEFYGDSRNEVGLLGLNTFLGKGNRAYVVRADINLNDTPETFIGLGTPVASTPLFVGIGNGTLTGISVDSAQVKPQTITVTFTGTGYGVTGSLSGHIGSSLSVTSSFNSTVVDFNVTQGSTPFVNGDKFTFELAYAATPSPAPVLTGTPVLTGAGNGTIAGIVASTGETAQTVTVTFSSASAFTVTGSSTGTIGTGSVGTAFANDAASFTVTAGSTPFGAGDTIVFVLAYASGSPSSNVGNGTVQNLRADSLAVPEVITIRFTTPTTFSVSNLFGSAGTGSVGSPYDDNRLNFTIVPGTTAFAAGDAFTVTASEITIANPLGASDAQRRVKIVTALQAAIVSNTEVRSEMYEYNLIICPGFPEVADVMATLSDDVFGEAMVLADTPCNLNPDQVAQWALTTERQSKNTVAYYYPWAIQANIDGRDVLGAPSAVALRTITSSDDQSYVWMAPAGAARGLTFNVARVGYVTGDLGTPTTFVQVNLNQGQRDNLYEYYKNINPITFFPGRGILVWGQKTSAPAASALDRINVVRLVMYLRRVLRKGAFPFVFEPNDQITRDNLKAAADGVLSDILTKRGLTDYATYCDATNNTPERIDKNELWLDVAIKPTRAAEFIHIPIRVVSTSATI